MTTSTQAWAILERHARDEIGPLRLQELCTDNDRVSSLVAVHTLNDSASSRFALSVRNSSSSGHPYPNESNLQSLSNRILIVDMSRQLMTSETLNHLLRLASAVNLRGFIQTLAWGHNNRLDPIQPQPKSSTDLSMQNDIPTHDMSDEYRKVGPESLVKNEKMKHFFKRTRFDDDATAASIRGTSNVGVNIGQSVLSPTGGSVPSPSNSRITIQTSPSMHLALRAPTNANLKMLTNDGLNSLNCLDDVHSQWKRIQVLSNSIRKGKVRGIGGHLLQHIVIVGQGVAFASLQFLFHALRRDEEGAAALCSGISESLTLGNVVSSTRKSNLQKQGRSMKFLSSIDPVMTTSVLTDCNPENTLIVTIAPRGDESDTLKLTQTLKDWLYAGLKSHHNIKRPEAVWSKHVILISGSDTLCQSQLVTKRECTFLIPQYARCEAFNTFSAAGLVPLSIAFGWDLVQEILNGAHDMDSHFVETNPRHNLPVLLALVDLWNEHFLPETSRVQNCGTRMITPFMDSFSAYPDFVAALESQICGRTGNNKYRSNSSNIAPSAVVINGGNNGAYDRVAYQGGSPPNTELIISMESQLPHKRNGKFDLGEVLLGSEDRAGCLTNQDHLMCSFFAHADVMAFGSTTGMRGRNGGNSFHSSGLGSASFDSHAAHSVFNDAEIVEGNRPSTLLVCGRCDAFTCGQLIALAEHRALVSAKLWDIDNPFSQAQSHASILRKKGTDMMREQLDYVYNQISLHGTYDVENEEAPDDKKHTFNIAARTLLGHYATRIREQEQRGGK